MHTEPPTVRPAPSAFARQHALRVAGGAIYSYIPKNACSTLRYSISVANGRPPGPDTLNGIHHGVGEYRATPAELAAARYRFVVLRCPYRRLASAFLDKVVKANPRGQDLLPKSLAERVADRIGKLRGHDSTQRTRAYLDRLHALTFEDFVGLVANTPAHRLDHHFRPQSDFLLYGGYDDVLSVEDFPQTTATLAHRIGLVVHDVRPALQHDAAQLRKSHDPAASMPVKALLAMKSDGVVPTYQALYSDVSREAVAAAYAPDIALYAQHIDHGGLLFPP